MGYPWGSASYYDTLARNAFGNYRTLMEDVTLHPAMGVYLSMLGNQKPDTLAQHPSRRELRARADAALHDRPGRTEPRRQRRGQCPGQPDPDLRPGRRSRDSRTFTPAGPTPVRRAFALAFPTIANQVVPMQAYAEQHDTGAKRVLLHRRGVHADPGRPDTAQQDLDDALDNIFRHPNVAPFISKQLIQRLVTSNPSPQYVERVARVFENDGAGQRGELDAVVKAILLDPEARRCARRRECRQARRAGAAPHALLARLWRGFDERQAERAEHPGLHRPGPAAGALGVQLLQPVLRAARRDPRPGAGGARDADRDGVPERAC